MFRTDLLCGVAKIALCEFGKPFPAAMIRAAVDAVEAWASEQPKP
jgi:hypothetical protein